MTANLLLVVIFLPAAGALVVALLGSRRGAVVRWCSLGVTTMTLALSLVVAGQYDLAAQREASSAGPVQPQITLTHTWLSYGGPANSVTTIAFTLGMDGISLWLVVLTAFLMVPAVLISWASIKDRIAEYYAYLLVLETGMLGVFCAFDLILFYLFFEFTLLPMFFLIGIWGGPERRYAAPKFFIYTLAGSLIGLVGLVALVLSVQAAEADIQQVQYQAAPAEWNETPHAPACVTFSIPELARRMRDQEAWMAGDVPAGSPAYFRPLTPEHRTALKSYWHRTQWWIFLALLVGFGVKVPLVPFHTWLPLAHVEAPTAGSVLLAGVLLKLGTYGFFRLCLPLLPCGVVSLGVPVVLMLAVVGILYGAFCAVVQDDIKKLVAYSSVSHLGYCMLGMFALNAEGLAGSVMQMLNHGLSTGGLFLLVGMVYDRYHTRKLSDLGGLAGRLPQLAFFMVIICLSSMGLPGLNGFVGEVLCLMGMFKVHWGYAVVGGMGVVLGAWYLLTVLQRGFFGPLREPAEVHRPVPDLSAREWAAIGPVALLCLLVGLYPKPLLQTIEPEVQAIARMYESHYRLTVSEPPR